VNDQANEQPEKKKPPEGLPDGDTPKRERGGFSLRGPLYWGAEFPPSVAVESRWIIRAIAISIPIGTILFGLSWLL
jgi:hypothetical protein